MINDNIVQSKRQSDATKKYFLNWILVAELLHLMKKFRDKVKMMISLQNIDERGANDPACHLLCQGLWNVL